MRYREGESPETYISLDQTMFSAGAVLGLFMGIGFVVAGVKTKKHWLTIWGAGLVIASIAYLVFVYH